MKDILEKEYPDDQIVLNLSTGDAIAVEADIVVDYGTGQIDAFVKGDRASWILEQYRASDPALLSVDFTPIQLRRTIGRITVRPDGEGVMISANGYDDRCVCAAAEVHR